MNVNYQHQQAPPEPVLPPGTCVVQPKEEKGSKAEDA